MKFVHNDEAVNSTVTYDFLAHQEKINKDVKAGMEKTVEGLKKEKEDLEKQREELVVIFN